MTEPARMETHQHDVEHWTVGRLREALRDLPDDMVLRAEVADGPSTWPGSEPWGNDQFVITAAAVDDGEHLRSDEFVLRIDHPAGMYVRRP
ncbi:DUF6225 family protein [Actinoplanes sp. NPDC048791]|uniref:DUF6225 family protein n=1 Tax=Actinoplanes sp. NPDC048791 TaxID=3154623 RepID=UPI003406C6BF